MANAAYPNTLFTMATIAHLSTDSSFLGQTITELIPKLTPDSDLLMQYATIQSIACLAKREIEPGFHELVARLFSVMQGTSEVALQCRCMEAINALRAGHADFMQPYYTRLIPMAASAVESWAAVAGDHPDLAIEPLTAALELDRMMLRAIPHAHAQPCLEIAAKELAIVPQISSVPPMCLIEAIDLLEFLTNTYPQETAVFCRRMMQLQKCSFESEIETGQAKRPPIALCCHKVR
jgi:hypothetical protein